MKARIKGQVAKYTESLQDRDGTYQFSKYTESTLLATDFAIFIQFLLGKNEYHESTKSFLLSCKESNGQIIDPKFDFENNQSVHKNDYIKWQFTFYSLMALDMAGEQFDALPFLVPFFETQYMQDWFDQLDWGHFWYESNKVMFLLYFSSYIEKYGNSELQVKAKELIEKIFKILNERQDPITGFWGTDRNNRNLSDGAFGAAHILLFYDYYNQEIPFPEKIIESTLTFHSTNGLILSVEGGACEDYDIVEIYFRVLKQTDFQADIVKENLLKMKQIIEKSQFPSGGFPYKVHKSRISFLKFWKSYFKKELCEKHYRYSSWDIMKTPVYCPDLWGSFFKLLSLGVIEKIVEGECDLKGYSLPSWGYLGD